MKNITYSCSSFRWPFFACFPQAGCRIGGQVPATMERVADWQLAHPNMDENPLSWTSATLWAGFFMAPPVWARLSSVTGDEKHLGFMDREFRAVTDYLYDTEEHLFFRDSRFFDRRSANGRKVFWSRGNGWVFGGLTLVLDEMPKDWPTRPFYENLFREMAIRLKTLQCDDGYWRSSLLDPSMVPEPKASGTAFFTGGSTGDCSYRPKPPANREGLQTVADDGSVPRSDTWSCRTAMRWRVRGGNEEAWSLFRRKVPILGKQNISPVDLVSVPSISGKGGAYQYATPFGGSNRVGYLLAAHEDPACFE